MIKTYKFQYQTSNAPFIHFEVNLDIFTIDNAKCLLEFFDWDYDDTNNLIDEIMEKYAMECLRIATFNNYNTIGVISEFDNKEGFIKLDGSSGVKLLYCEPYEFDEYDLILVQ